MTELAAIEGEILLGFEGEECDSSDFQKTAKIRVAFSLFFRPIWIPTFHKGRYPIFARLFFSSSR